MELNPTTSSRTDAKQLAARQLIAFYLPQYHPIAENDAWWGRGFTEWTNVSKAKSLFPGHYQPHLPADLGFYDLRLPEARQAQADLARQYGIGGFCYYHYWFNGRRVLERPFDEVLKSGEPDFPFCLCWANEDWTRTWDGRGNETLLGQNYTAEDDIAHLRALAPAFCDARYIRMDGKPLFLVYRASRLPEPKATLERWRHEAARLGVGELFLCRVESMAGEQGDPRDMGFDAAVEFQPRWRLLGQPLQRGPLWRLARRLGAAEKAFALHRIFDYGAYVEQAINQPPPSYPRFAGACPSWDNTARRPRDAVIFTGSTPQLYGRWLEHALRQSPNLPNLQSPAPVFINAWNEWAEGNHLEPCRQWGHGYLEATRQALQQVVPATAPQSVATSA